MICIGIRFNSGRFHATPWGRHVNEGVPEWPPSQWRLMRSLIATWKRRVPDQIDDVTMSRLLGRLAAPPLYYLPPASMSHTRHFMPWDKNWETKGPEAKTLVFDCFVAINPEDRLLLLWPDAELDSTERRALILLLERLTYFGRAESWCEAGLVDEVPVEPNCRPLNANEAPGEGHEIVRVLCSSAPLDMHSLFVETSDLRKQRLNPLEPPGSRWVPYVRRRDCFEPKLARRTISSEEAIPTFAYFAVDGAVRPLLTDSVTLGDLARSATMAVYGRQNDGKASRALSGKDEQGKPMNGNKHAHYISVDSDNDGWIDHLAIWAPMGFNSKEQEALGSLRALNPGNGGQTVDLVLLGMGQASQIPSPLTAVSRSWHSATPFILIRHPKLRGDTKGGTRSKRLVDGPEDQVILELMRRGLPKVERILPMTGSMLRGRTVPWLAFHRWRKRGKSAGGASGFVLIFAEPVQGPIAIGYGAHFGLGVFMPGETEEGSRRTVR